MLFLADAHLGKGAATIPGRLDDQEAALAQAAQLAIAEKVDVVLFGGDMFEGPGVPSSHYLRVRRAFCEPLKEAKIRVFAVSGNSRHDSAGNEGEENAMAVLGGPGFNVATRPMIFPYVRRLVDERSVTMPTAAAIACMPWADASRLRARLNGNAPEDADATTAELLLRIATDLHAEARESYPGVPVVLLMHGTLSGWATPTGLATDQIAAVIDSDRLAAVGFDAVLCGHIHRPGVVNRTFRSGADTGLAEKIECPLIYAGSPLPLDHGEANCEHGVWLLDIEPGNVVAEFRPLESRRFVTLDFDHELGDVETQLALAEYIGWDPAMTGAIVRARYTLTAEQAARLTKQDVEQALLAGGAFHATAEPDVIRESRARVEGVTESLAPMDALDAWLGVQDPPLDGALAEGVRSWTREALT